MSDTDFKETFARLGKAAANEDLEAFEHELSTAMSRRGFWNRALERARIRQSICGNLTSIRGTPRTRRSGCSSGATTRSSSGGFREPDQHVAQEYIDPGYTPLRSAEGL